MSLNMGVITPTNGGLKMKRKPLNYHELQKEWNPKDLTYYLSVYTKNELATLLLLLKQGRISFDDENEDSQ